MITSNVFRTRQRDGVVVLVLGSKAYIEKSTLKYFSEVPEGRAESEFNTTFCGHVRCDQTGDIYEIVHVPEESPYTFTEVFPDPACTINNRSTVFFRKYPDYNTTITYHKGDIVIYNGRTFECEEDELTGVAPDIWGWDEILPRIEETEHVYKTLAEIYGEDA